MKVIMYVRKSSEDEDRQVMSIPAQIKELRALSARQGFSVVGQPVEESKSAKEPDQRPLFASVLKRIAKGEADGILCWHLDRLARNPIDGAVVIHRLAKQIIKVVATPDRTYLGTPEDKLLMMVQFGMSTQFSDNLSRNIKRGYRQAIATGRWPCSRVPVGYLRNPQTLAIVRDRKRWDLVAQLWRLRLAGATMDEVVRVAQVDLGLRARSAARRRTTDRARDGQPNGALLCPSQIMDIFHNPFYCGLMRFRGSIYDGKHEPMVTPAEFWSLQDVQARQIGNGKIELPYRHLLRCGLCGMQFTPERHVKPSGLVFVYYRCTSLPKHRGACRARFIPLRAVEDALGEFFRTVQLPASVVSLAIDELSAVQRQRGTVNDAAQRESDAEHRRLGEADKRLLAAYLNGHVSEQELSRERARIRARQEQLAEAPPEDTLGSRIELLKNQISSLNAAEKVLQSGNWYTKTALASDFMFELTVTDGILAVQAREPFLTISRTVGDPLIWSSREQVRTLVEQLVHSSTADRQSDAGEPAVSPTKHDGIIEVYSPNAQPL